MLGDDRPDFKLKIITNIEKDLDCFKESSIEKHLNSKLHCRLAGLSKSRMRVKPCRSSR